MATRELRVLPASSFTALRVLPGSSSTAHENYGTTRLEILLIISKRIQTCDIIMKRKPDGTGTGYYWKRDTEYAFVQSVLSNDMSYYFYQVKGNLCITGIRGQAKAFTGTSSGQLRENGDMQKPDRLS